MSETSGPSSVAIVGAGITGLSIASHLVAAGERSVLVYERAGVAAEASGVQPGGFRQQWGTRVNCLMARESVAFYRDLVARLGARVDPGYRECGYLFAAHTRETLDRLAGNVALQRELGIPSRLVSPEEAAALVPGMDVSAVVGASYCPEDGYFDRPQSVVEAFADAAVRGGARIVHGQVTELRPAGGGWELLLAERGAERAEQVVVAAGYGTPVLLASLGIEVPIEREARYLFLSEPIRERLVEPLVVAPDLRFAAKHLADGRLLASDLGAAGDPDELRDAWRASVRQSIRRLLPVLEYVSFPLMVEGFYDMTPDHQALLGRVDGHDGLWLAAGFSGHGFMMAPAVGRVLADALLGREDAGFLDVLAPGRFERGRLVVEEQVV